jgi:hypothetical protein
MKKYAKWIEENVHYPYGQCKKYAELMCATFPELVLVRGHYDCPIWGMREHWWCATQNNQIIDPTKEQFPSKGFFEYHAWDNTKEEPTGKCRECGEYTYNNKYFCSEECDKKYMTYLNQGL